MEVLEVHKKESKWEAVPENRKNGIKGKIT
jgi:hypothetical protein